MIDLLMVLALIAYAVTSGFRARARASELLTEYFLAGKTLTWWQAGTFWGSGLEPGSHGRESG